MTSDLVGDAESGLGSAASAFFAWIARGASVGRADDDLGSELART
jgi:hypothetical protein